MENATTTTGRRPPLSVRCRQGIERVIIRRFVKTALRYGYAISVFDGEETTVKRSLDASVIMKAIMTTDEDFLELFRLNESPKRQGWVRLIYGNSGYDVINDYTTNLEYLMTVSKMQELIDKYELLVLGS
jgi:hypothetical protein